MVRIDNRVADTKSHKRETPFKELKATTHATAARRPSQGTSTFLMPTSDVIAAFASLSAVKRTHLAAALLLPAAMVTLTGCFNGQGATTTTQASMNSGNGVQARQGDIRIENATVVMGPEGTQTATLLVRVINDGVETDALTYATINGQPAEILVPTAEGDAATTLEPGASVSFGWDSDLRIDAGSLDVPVSSYVPVELGFQNAGLASLSVLTVPQAGYYEDVTILP